MSFPTNEARSPADALQIAEGERGECLTRTTTPRAATGTRARATRTSTGTTLSFPCAWTHVRAPERCHCQLLPRRRLFLGAAGKPVLRGADRWAPCAATGMATRMSTWRTPVNSTSATRRSTSPSAIGTSAPSLSASAARSAGGIHARSRARSYSAPYHTAGRLCGGFFHLFSDLSLPSVHAAVRARSGKTALVLSLCRHLRDKINMGE